LFLISAFLLNGFTPARAQDVVTSDDFTGGSSAFVFKTSRKPTQRKFAVRATNFSRSKSAKLESVKRLAKQAVTVAKVNPKRTRSKEFAPPTTAAESDAIRRKSPQEASVVFAGVGEYFLTRDNLDESINWFREAIQLDENNVNAKNGLSDALALKGTQLLSKENDEIAKMLFDEALKNNPKNAAAHAGLAEYYSARDDNEKALASYEKALSYDADLTELYAPLGVLYFQKGEVAKAETYLQKAVAANPDNSETQFYLGLLRYKQNRYEEAATAFKRALELDPTNSEAQYYLGEVFDRLNQDKDAIAAYQKAVQMNPKYTEAWFDLGVAYFNRDKLPEAIEAYKKAISLKPTHGEAYANLADIYRLTGKLDEAISAYRLATTFIKDDPELYSKFGYVAARRAMTPAYRSFWKTAIDNFEKAIAVTPGGSDYIDYTNLGWAYYNAAQSEMRARNEAGYKTDLEKARDAFVKANAMKPLPKVAAAINLNLGMTLTDLGDYQGSIAVLKAASDSQKNWVPAINELGIAYRKSGDLENAAKQFKRAVEVDDKFASGYYNLAEAEYRRNNLKEAKKQYEKLKTLNRPDLVATLELATNGGIKR
jgi:superkiller protein 3